MASPMGRMIERRGRSRRQEFREPKLAITANNNPLSDIAPLSCHPNPVENIESLFANCNHFFSLSIAWLRGKRISCAVNEEIVLMRTWWKTVASFFKPAKFVRYKETQEVRCQPVRSANKRRRRSSCIHKARVIVVEAFEGSQGAFLGDITPR